MNEISARVGGVAVLATCFNRREVTLTGLHALRKAAVGMEYHVYLVDDGSTDGTAQSVRAEFPEVTVIEGDGSLYWNGGMRRAWQAAVPHRPAYYMLFNDDLELTPDGIPDMMAFQREKEAQHGDKVISVGKVMSPDGTTITYGGYVLAPGRSKLRFLRATDSDTPCTTMNGNCVLIPGRAVEDIGILDEHYRHHTGDIDYGLRARYAGYKLFQTREPIGRTDFNATAHAQRAQLTWANRNFILRHPKGLPVDEWLYFCRRHAGVLWPVNFLYRYAKILQLRGAK